MADVDLSDQPDAETVERRLHDAYVGHGEQPPPWLTGISRALAAGNGPRGTRLPRLLGLGVRAAGRAVRWAWQPGEGDEKDRRSLRRMYLSLGVVIGIDGVLTAVAVRSPGWRRLPWAVVALTVWLRTLRGIAVATFVTTLVRRPEA